MRWGAGTGLIKSKPLRGPRGDDEVRRVRAAVNFVFRSTRARARARAAAAANWSRVELTNMPDPNLVSAGDERIAGTTALRLILYSRETGFRGLGVFF